MCICTLYSYGQCYCTVLYIGTAPCYTLGLLVIYSYVQCYCKYVVCYRTTVLYLEGLCADKMHMKKRLHQMWFFTFSNIRF